MPAGESFVAERWWRHGRPAELWINYQREVERFKNEWRLDPLDQRHLSSPMSVASFDVHETEKAEARRLPRPRPFPGGLRFAHFHLGDDIYRLTRDQWETFSKAVVEDFSAKLRSAGSVSFRHALEMGEVMSELG